MVRLFPPIAPTVSLDPFTSPIVAAQVPVSFVFTGSATSSQAPIAVVQYKVEGGQFANAVNVSGNWSQFSITLPLPPTAGGPDHVLTVRAIDTFGTTGEISQAVRGPARAADRGAAGQRHHVHRRADDIVDHQLDAARAAVHAMPTSAPARARACSIRCGC